jgi:hypothetical protein
MEATGIKCNTIRDEEFDQLSDYQLSKKDRESRTYIVQYRERPTHAWQ